MTKDITDALSLLRRAVILLERAKSEQDSAAQTEPGKPSFAENTRRPILTRQASAPKVVERPVQQDLFTESQFEAGLRAIAKKSAAAREKAKAKAAVRKRGTPGIGKAQALKNFREIAGSKELLTLAEVNRIFGYNESTHGRFVKDAIKSGKLPAVKYGEKRKFVAREVRRFIDEYYSGF